MSEPVEVSLVAALGVVIAGFLFWIAIKIVDARRRRIFVERSESHWVDDPNAHELRDEQRYAESVLQREELVGEFIDPPESDWMDRRNEHELHDGEQRSGLAYQEAKLIDDLQGSAILTEPQRRDRKPNLADEIGKREDRLEQLKRDVDRLLRSSKVA